MFGSAPCRTSKSVGWICDDRNGNVGVDKLGLSSESMSLARTPIAQSAKTLAINLKNSTITTATSQEPGPCSNSAGQRPRIQLHPSPALVNVWHPEPRPRHADGMGRCQAVAAAKKYGGNIFIQYGLGTACTANKSIQQVNGL